MLRDFAIVSTAFGVDSADDRRPGWPGSSRSSSGWSSPSQSAPPSPTPLAIATPVSLTTIGAGAATYIVGPVTGTALGASSERDRPFSVAAGLVKSVLVMVGTPFVARLIGLDNPASLWSSAA